MTRYAVAQNIVTVKCEGCGTRITPAQLYYAYPEYRMALMEMSGFWDAGRQRPLVTVCSQACDAMVLARGIRREDYPVMERTEMIDDGEPSVRTVIMHDRRRLLLS
jgi:hypothetical protein